jgi:hypothetical protein
MRPLAENRWLAHGARDLVVILVLPSFSAQKQYIAEDRASVTVAAFDIAPPMFKTSGY